ncbi:MAG: hypothetical protein LDL14_02805 [Nitrospira sp.]|nr:hypothetical protein [Nitrospira sp.]
MEIDRRSLMKGMLASGTLLALGVPAWAFVAPPPRRPDRCVLLLGGTDADAGFANGARAACDGKGFDGLKTVALHCGLLTEMDRMVTLLDQTRGARMIAVMDDAAAVVFLELARTAGARLLSMDTHVCSTGHACRLRHDWVTTGPAYGMGGFLASQLRQAEDEFVIMETFLQAPPDEHAVSGWTAPRFSSYRVGGVSADMCMRRGFHSKKHAACWIGKSRRNGRPFLGNLAVATPSRGKGERGWSRWGTPSRLRQSA